MKRFNVTLSLILVIGINAIQAQSSFSGGIWAGAALTNLHGNDIKGNSPLNTLKGGGFLTYKFNSNVAIQAESNLDFKGATQDLMLNGFPYKKVKLIYLQIPLLLKLSSSKEWGDTGFRPAIFVGPALDIMLDKELSGEHLVNVDGGYSVDHKAKANAFELIGGLGGTINDFYVVNLRYGYGLTNVFQEGEATTSSIALTVGLKF